jgi:hypothetical protein
VDSADYVQTVSHPSRALVHYQCKRLTADTARVCRSAVANALTSVMVGWWFGVKLCTSQMIAVHQARALSVGAHHAVSDFGVPLVTPARRTVTAGRRAWPST